MVKVVRIMYGVYDVYKNNKFVRTVYPKNIAQISLYEFEASKWK